MMGSNGNKIITTMALFIVLGHSYAYSQDIITHNKAYQFGVSVIDAESSHFKYSFDCNNSTYSRKKGGNTPHIYLTFHLDKKLLRKIFEISSNYHESGGGIGGLKDLDIWISIVFDDEIRRFEFDENNFDYIPGELIYGSDRGAEQGGWMAAFDLGSLPPKKKNQLLFEKVASSRRVHLELKSWGTLLQIENIPDIARKDAFESIYLGCDN